MPETFIVVRAYKKEGNSYTHRLINVDAFEKGDKLEDFFPPGFSHIKELGRVEVEGDTHLLTNSYTEDD